MAGGLLGERGRGGARGAVAVNCREDGGEGGLILRGLRRGGLGTLRRLERLCSPGDGGYRKSPFSVTMATIDNPVPAGHLSITRSNGT